MHELLSLPMHKAIVKALAAGWLKSNKFLNNKAGVISLTIILPAFFESKVLNTNMFKAAEAAIWN
jgi:hypothetical protein